MIKIRITAIRKAFFPDLMAKVDPKGRKNNRMRFIALLLAAVLCAVLAGCVARPAAPSTEPTETAPSAAAADTQPATEVTGPTVGGSVTPPGEMPDPPGADYSIPPEEGAGDRDEMIDR